MPRGNYPALADELDEVISTLHGVISEQTGSAFDVEEETQFSRKVDLSNDDRRRKTATGKETVAQPKQIEQRNGSRMESAEEEIEERAQWIANSRKNTTGSPEKNGWVRHNYHGVRG